jgi:hypothetical protein
MTKHTTPEKLFEQAIIDFPYPNLQPTHCTQGDLEPDDKGEIEYAGEYIFDAGTLFDEELVGGGWIDLRQADGETSVTAFCGVARNGDWEKGRILPDTVAVQGIYDPSARTWEFWIDQY